MLRTITYYDNLSLVDSQSKVTELLGEIGNKINECKNSTDFKKFIGNHPKLSPIILCFFFGLNYKK